MFTSKNTLGKKGSTPVGTRSHLPSWQWNPKSTEGSMYWGLLMRRDQIHGRVQRVTIFLPDEQNFSQKALLVNPKHLVTAIKPMANQLAYAFSNVHAPMNLHHPKSWGQKVCVNMKMYVGMHVTQKVSSNAARFKINTVLVCQCSSNLNL